MGLFYEFRLDDWVPVDHLLKTLMWSTQRDRSLRGSARERRKIKMLLLFAWITNEMPIMQGGELEHYLEVSAGRAWTGIGLRR